MLSLIKLVNGETLVCSVIERTESGFLIEDPLKLEIVNHGGVPSMMTTYWIPLPDDELRVDIWQDHVIMISDMTEDLEKFYLKALKHARGIKPIDNAKVKADKDKDNLENDIKNMTNQQKKKLYAAVAGLSANTVFH
jgi:hypothetical protein